MEHYGEEEIAEMIGFEISLEEFEKLEDLSEGEIKVSSWLTEHNIAVIKGLDYETFHKWFSLYCYCKKDEIPKLEEMCRRIKSRPEKERFFSKKELSEIISWKLAFDPRLQRKSLKRYDTEETDETIQNKTRILFDESTSVEEKVHKIAGHRGGRKCNQCRRTKITSVGVPVASAILRFIDPSKYAIIDQKVMDALHILGFKGIAERKQWGSQRSQYRFEPFDYVCYLELVTEISKRVDMLPCQVDMALWKSQTKC